MGWRWSSLAKFLDPWLEGEPDESARVAVLRQMATLVEHAEWITGDEVTGRPPLIRSYVVEEARVRLVWLRSEQFHDLDLVAIEPLERLP